MRKEQAKKTWPNLKTIFFQAHVDLNQESKHNIEACATENLANCDRSTGYALQTMLKVSNAAWEEQAQHVDNLTVQN